MKLPMNYKLHPIHNFFLSANILFDSSTVYIVTIERFLNEVDLTAHRKK